MSIIVAGNDYETIFLDGADDPEAPLIWTCRCNFCPHEEVTRFEAGERIKDTVREQKAVAEGVRTASAMFDHVLENHPEKLFPGGL